MLTVEATVVTAHARRYLDRFCRHAQQVHRIRHLPGMIHGGHTPPAGRVTVQRGDDRAILDFGTGRCALLATADALAVRVEADDEQDLRRIQDIISRDLDRFGRREHPAVAWQQPDTALGTGPDAAPDAG